MRGEWLRPGVHLDLIGSFTPDMRETDDAAMSRARIFIDTPTALEESGDLMIPLARKVITEASIQADLAALSANRHPGRGNDSEITLFKSTGMALEDLAAAMLVFGRATAR